MHVLTTSVNMPKSSNNTRVSREPMVDHGLYHGFNTETSRSPRLPGIRMSEADTIA
jgi:hypothetical protein